MNKHLIWFALVILVLAACDKTDPGPNNIEGSVLINNEGNFQSANASLDVLDLETETVSSSVFADRNGEMLGDVFQSITKIGERLYLVVNNSNKVEIVNESDYTSVATVEGLTSPRYVHAVSNDKAYITDLFGGSIAVLNLNTNTIDSSIPLAGWSEQMWQKGERVFVAHPGNDYLYVINSANDEIIDSVQVALGGGDLREDTDGNLWVLCSGQSFNNIAGGLYQIDPDNLSVLQSFDFTASDSPSELSMNDDGTRLYYLLNGVKSMAITATALPTTNLIEGSFYGMEIDPETDWLYLTDAKDFQQRGDLLRFQDDGTPVDTFAVGIGPGDVFFP
ncbi:MAG: DUF5074 domain-containing protein [Bacteroidota bacterium]